MVDRVLDVILEDEPIGNLQEGSGIWRYSYSRQWTEKEQAFAIAPGLPLGDAEIVDGGSVRPVQWFFDNLLPEEGLREQLARERKLSGADAFGLLAAYGAESAGSLTLLSPGSRTPPPGRRPLPKTSLSARIRHLPRTSLEAKAPKKMSLAGAQHKLAVILDGDELFEPEGSEASTHILKPNHQDARTYPHSVINEWFVLQLASHMGLDVPRTFHDYCPEPYFLIERFDRARHENKVRRLHAIDACQLLNLDRAFKHHSMSLESLTRIAEATRSRAFTRVRLFRWCIFNALVGNADAHLKNLSFLVGSDGIELAPHYDMVSTALFEAEQASKWRKVKTSLPIAQARTFVEIDRDTIVALAGSLQVRPQVALRTLDQMIDRISAAADRIITSFEQESVPAAAKGHRAGESRVLRQIRHVTIADMAKQLSAR